MGLRRDQVRQATMGRQGAGTAAYGEAVNHARDFASDNPVGLLLTAAGVGLVLGSIMARR